MKIEMISFLAPEEISSKTLDPFRKDGATAL